VVLASSGPADCTKGGLVWLCVLRECHKPLFGLFDGGFKQGHSFCLLESLFCEMELL